MKDDSSPATPTLPEGYKLDGQLKDHPRGDELFGRVWYPGLNGWRAPSGGENQPWIATLSGHPSGEWWLAVKEAVPVAPEQAVTHECSHCRRKVVLPEPFLAVDGEPICPTCWPQIPSAKLKPLSPEHPPADHRDCAGGCLYGLETGGWPGRICPAGECLQLAQEQEQPPARSAGPDDIEAMIHAVRMAAGSNQFTIELCGKLADICTLALSAAEWKLRASAARAEAEGYREALDDIRSASTEGNDPYVILSRIDSIVNRALAEKGEQA